MRAEVAKAHSQRYREEIETEVMAHGAMSGIMSKYRYRTGVTTYVCNVSPTSIAAYCLQRFRVTAPELGESKT